MTPEERYERIDARLEAIAMHLELTAAMAKASEERMEKIEQKFGERIEQLLTAVEKDAENIRALARIAEIHEHRLSDLEGGERKN
jgi:ribosome-associated translation inhibitor RaiA